MKRFGIWEVAVSFSVFFGGLLLGEDDWAKVWLEIPNNKSFDQKAAAIREQIPTASLSVGLDDSHLRRAVIHDLTGDFHKAAELYRKAIDRTMTPPIAARRHLIRILRDHFPEKLKAGIWDLKQFEDHIAWIGQFSCSTTIDATRMESSLSKVVFGEFVMAPLWRPGQSMEGKFSSRFQIADQQILGLRRHAFELWCRDALENPELSAWAFSRIAALADLDGKFENNPELIELAKTALTKMEKPTPFGAVPEAELPYDSPGEMPVRMYAPELYLAWHITKGDLPAGEIADNPGVKGRLSLLTCHATDFFKTVDTLIGKDFKRTLEAIQISELREQQVNLLEHLLVSTESPNQDLLPKADMGNGEFLFLGPHPRRPVRSWVRVLDRVVREDKSDARLLDALNRLAVCYLGPIEKQKSVLQKDRPPEGVIICGIESEAGYYLRLLKEMMKFSSLAAPGYRKAEQLLIANRIYRKPSRYISETKRQQQPEILTNKLRILVSELNQIIRVNNRLFSPMST